jgi:hypothetical protein
MASDHPPGPFASHDQWLAVVGPWMDLVDDVVSLGINARSRNPRLFAPRASSEAGAELAAEPEITGAWSSSPVRSIHSTVRFLLTSGEDAMAAYATLARSERTPVFAHLAVARSAVEALAKAAFLCSPGIGATERLRRHLNFELESLWSRTKLTGEDTSGIAAQILEATALGFETVERRRGLRQFSPAPDTVTATIKAVLGDEEGALFYGYTSSVAHGTNWGLMTVVGDGHRPSPGGLAEVDLEIRSEDYISLVSPLLAAHLHTFTMYALYMGWDLRAYTARWVRAAALIGTLIEE